MMNIPVLLASLAICISPALRGNDARTPGSEISKAQDAWRATIAGPSRSSPGSPCEATGKKELRITCYYMSTPHSASAGIGPRIVLNRSVLSFDTNDQNYMHVELTFTNAGTSRISAAHPVYLAIDDQAGHNHVRRVLPQVDFRKLAPGERLTFSDRLLVPAFRPGHYAIQLWIPNPDPFLRFNAAHNLLLGSAGVADPATGLNTLAAFTVVR